MIKENEYMVEITEVLSRLVKINASSREDAISKVEEKYFSGEITLNAEDMKESDINVYKEIIPKKKRDNYEIEIN